MQFNRLTLFWRLPGSTIATRSQQLSSHIQQRTHLSTSHVACDGYAMSLTDPNSWKPWAELFEHWRTIAVSIGVLGGLALATWRYGQTALTWVGQTFARTTGKKKPVLRFVGDDHGAAVSISLLVTRVSQRVCEADHIARPAGRALSISHSRRQLPDGLDPGLKKRALPAPRHFLPRL